MPAKDIKFTKSQKEKGVVDILPNIVPLSGEGPGGGGKGVTMTFPVNFF